MRMVAAMLLAIFASVLSPALAGETQPVLVGDTAIHDPSVIVLRGIYVAFGTGTLSPGEGAIRIKTSPDGLTWHDAGTLGVGIPAWVMPTIHASPRELWAPSVSQRDGTVYLYYAASVFGVNTSAIGLTTNSSFDPKNPAAGWTDAGLVLMSRHGDNFNAIDPARIDTPDGRAWLALGSFWSGIKMRELDPASGMLNAGNPEFYSLASRGGGAIEAASILRHGDFYYLFVSFDRCCAGTASTYRIMVGRSAKVTGPYVANDGTPMLQGGATEVQKSQGRFVGPGGQEAFATPDGEYLAYHYYDGKQGGSSRLEIAPIRWKSDGWPQLDPLPPD
jgi:arabinan endo-1,5-alpha-L-arabinosidase